MMSVAPDCKQHCMDSQTQDLLLEKKNPQQQLGNTGRTDEPYDYNHAKTTIMLKPKMEALQKNKRTKAQSSVLVFNGIGHSKMKTNRNPACPQQGTTTSCETTGVFTA